MTSHALLLKVLFCFAKKMSHSFIHILGMKTTLFASSFCTLISAQETWTGTFCYCPFSLSQHSRLISALLKVSFILQGPITHFPTKGKWQILCIQISFHKYYHLHALYHHPRCTGTKPQLRYVFPSYAFYHVNSTINVCSILQTWFLNQ